MIVSEGLRVALTNSGIDWFLDPSVNCLFTRTYGLVNKQLALEYALKVRKDPRYENHFHVLSDITNCEFDVTSDDLREMAQFQNENWPTEIKHKSAMIVNSMLAHGLARSFGVYNEQRNPDLTLFNGDDPELIKKLALFFELPLDYPFPSFLSFKS